MSTWISAAECKEAHRGGREARRAERTVDADETSTLLRILLAHLPASHHISIDKGASSRAAARSSQGVFLGGTSWLPSNIEHDLRRSKWNDVRSSAESRHFQTKQRES